MKKTFTILSAAILLTLFVRVAAVNAVELEQAVEAFDTIQGFETVVKTTGGLPGEYKTITVTRPGGQAASFGGLANQAGLTRITISEAFLNEPGSYVVSLTNPKISSSFQVYSQKPIEKNIKDFNSSLTLSDSAVGGDPRILIAQANQSIARFEIENIPASVLMSQRVNFTLTAVDSAGTVVPSYIGTVQFSSTDVNAQLPTAYTFQTSDQGRKTFDLGLSFGTVGTQRLTVFEQGNALLKGEKTLEVTRQAAGGVSQVRITKPATGTYSVNTLEVAGEATPNSRVKLYDNSQQIAEVQSNSMGRYAYTTSLLSDGRHIFQAESNGIQSEPVTVTIDSTPAQVQRVEIAESVLAPGANTTIVIESDPELSAVQAAVGDFIIDLDPDINQPGVYSGTITAPNRDGEYTVNIFLTDRVGNVSPAAEVGKLRVDSSLRNDSTFSFSVPTKVSGLQAVAGNKGARLTWTPSQAESGIAMYRIYYGTSRNSINTVINTPGPETAIIVPDLQNNVEYFFQVSGIDRQGNEGDLRSDIVRATPSADALDDYSRATSASPSSSSTAVPASSSGSDGGPVLCSPGPCPADAGSAPYTPEDGPGIVGLIIASLIGGKLLRGRRRV